MQHDNIWTLLSICLKRQLFQGLIDDNSKDSNFDFNISFKLYYCESPFKLYCCKFRILGIRFRDPWLIAANPFC